MTVLEKQSYAVTAFSDAAGTIPTALGATDTLSVTSADTDSATIVPDTNPKAGTVASGFVVAGKKLATGLVITCTINRAGGTPLTATATVDVTALPADAVQGLGFVLGPAVAQ